MTIDTGPNCGWVHKVVYAYLSDSIGSCCWYRKATCEYQEDPLWEPHPYRVETIEILLTERPGNEWALWVYTSVVYNESPGGTARCVWDSNWAGYSHLTNEQKEELCRNENTEDPLVLDGASVEWIANGCSKTYDGTITLRRVNVQAPRSASADARRD